MKRGRQAKDERRKVAESLTQQRATRTDKQQIAKLDAEGWAAMKERVRLLRRIKKAETEQSYGKKAKA